MVNHLFYKNILLFILDECWVKFLQSINKTCMNEAQSMLSVWLRRELEKNVITRVQSDRKFSFDIMIYSEVMFYLLNDCR